MNIRLDKIGAEPFRWQELVAVSAERLERTQLLELGEVSWSGQVWDEDPGYRCEASYSYEQTIACDRCLAPIVRPVAGEVRLLLMTNSPQPTADEVELTAEDLEILPLAGEEFDPQEVLIEQLQLNVPMRALCTETCKGLCPECGVNRNHEECGCEEARIDPRWEALRGLGSEK
jgi:uncharacterized protein